MNCYQVATGGNLSLAVKPGIECKEHKFLNGNEGIMVRVGVQDFEDPDKMNFIVVHEKVDSFKKRDGCEPPRLLEASIIKPKGGSPFFGVCQGRGEKAYVLFMAPSEATVDISPFQAILKKGSARYVHVYLIEVSNGFVGVDISISTSRGTVKHRVTYRNGAIATEELSRNDNGEMLGEEVK